MRTVVWCYIRFMFAEGGGGREAGKMRAPVGRDIYVVLSEVDHERRHDLLILEGNSPALKGMSMNGLGTTVVGPPLASRPIYREWS